MKRFLDLILCFLLLPFLLVPLIFISLLVLLTSQGPIIYFSKRVGKNGIIFFMPKFRTMKAETPQLASHLIKNPELYITSVGRYLRKYSLDELPQLFSIIFGKMSFVGPRPALYNQENLINLRKKNGVDKLMPGITGWAQINGRDEISISTKSLLDEHYLKNKSVSFDFYILWKTFLIVLKKQGISH